MDFDIFCCSVGSHVSVDPVHPSLLRSYCFFSQVVPSRLSPDEFLVSPLYVSKPPQSCFPAPYCDIQSLPGIIVYHADYHLDHYLTVINRYFRLHNRDQANVWQEIFYCTKQDKQTVFMRNKDIMHDFFAQNQQSGAPNCT